MAENKLYEISRNKFLDGHQDLRNLEGLTKQGFFQEEKWQKKKQ